MYEEIELTNLPQWLSKDIVTLRHEVPIAGGSGSRLDEYYSPRLLRWALDSWLHHLPAGADAAALQRALMTALADERAFRAYLRVPEAFLDAYQDEIAKVNERRSELHEMKRLLSVPRRRPLDLLPRISGAAICFAVVFAVLRTLL